MWWASWTSKLVQVWERGIRNIIILLWIIFIFKFLQCKECFIKCTFSIAYYFCSEKKLLFQRWTSESLIDSNSFFYVDMILLLLAVVFTRYLQSRSHALFIQGLNLYPLEIVATAQNVACRDGVCTSVLRLALCLHVKD